MQEFLRDWKLTQLSLLFDGCKIHLAEAVVESSILAVAFHRDYALFNKLWTWNWFISSSRPICFFDNLSGHSLFSISIRPLDLFSCNFLYQGIHDVFFQYFNNLFELDEVRDCLLLFALCSDLSPRRESHVDINSITA